MNLNRNKVLTTLLFIVGLTTATNSMAERAGQGGSFHEDAGKGFNNRFDNDNPYRNNNNFNRSYDNNHQDYNNVNTWAVPVINVGVPNDDFNYSTPCPTFQQCDSDGQCTIQQNC